MANRYMTEHDRFSRVVNLRAPELFVTLSGVMCCGPAPVKAIKEGELTKEYDAPFIFAEVSFSVLRYAGLTLLFPAFLLQ